MNLPRTPERGDHRIASVDILRGLTMLVMIFVNDLAGVEGLPWWTYHLPAKVNGMTYVDWIFPGFLFAVGLSLPLAISRRVRQGDYSPALWKHIVARSLSLALLGIILANISKLDPQLTGLSKEIWSLASFLGAFLLWGVYPWTQNHPRLKHGMRWSGFLLIALMMVLFRRKTATGSTAWLDFSYWEILGLIGWTYLAVCILYIPFRKVRWAPAAWLAVLCCMNLFIKMEWLQFLRRLPIYVWPFGSGALASIVMAGIVCAGIFLDSERPRSFREKAIGGTAFAVIMFIAGWFLTPYGISKIRATPTWCLYCSGITTLLFLLLYWIVDVEGHSQWAGFVKPAGANTLLTYLLPDVFYAVAGFHYTAAYFEHGLPGVAKSLMFTALMLGCSALLTRLNYRMRL
jgi:heparan-alpha-glucosaminide N-acetyltransferase